MQTAFPAATFPVVWDDDGPVDYGAQPSDQGIGETEMVVTAVSLQAVRAFTAPQHPISVDHAEVPSYPSPYYYITAVQSPLAPVRSLYTPYQDTVAGGQVADDLTMALSAPEIPIAGTMLTRGNG